MLHTRPSSSSLHARPGFTSRSQASLSLPPGLGCTYGVGSLHGALLRHAAKADIRTVCCMRQATCILTLLALVVFTATCVSTDRNLRSTRIITASRSALVIEYSGRTIFPTTHKYVAFSTDLRSYLNTKADRHCDRYDRDAVFVRWERTLLLLAPLIISHYRCEPR